MSVPGPWPVLFGLALLAAPALTHAEERLYVIAIGNNDAPQSASDPGLEPLRFADDDAAAFYTFGLAFAQQASLLAVLDRDSQRRFPRAAAAAQAPTLTNLRNVVEQTRARLVEDQRAGNLSRVWIFYSGHGLRPTVGTPSLTLSDGPLTREILYDEVLAQLPARYLHVFVDACHAEAIVRPRDGGSADNDASAETVQVTDDDVREWSNRETLRRFPNVGAVIAASSGQAAHEWDVYEQGVFTHQLLSGLRGAADVNRDGKVEYSEMHAFLAAANREVADPRAHLDVVVVAPSVNLRAPIVNLREARRVGWLSEVPASFGHFHIEDEAGRRLIDAHAEPGFLMALALPPDMPLYLRRSHHEARFELRPGQRMAAASLRFGAPSLRTRGAIVSSLRHGLFTAAFGPRYYMGFVDETGDESVSFEATSSTPAHDRALTDALAYDEQPSVIPSIVAFAAAGALGVTAAVFGGLMIDASNDFDSTDLHRPAAEAADRYENYRLGLIFSAGAGVIAAGLGLWLYPWGRDGHAAQAPTTVGLCSDRDGTQLFVRRGF